MVFLIERLGGLELSWLAYGVRCLAGCLVGTALISDQDGEGGWTENPIIRKIINQSSMERTAVRVIF